MVKAHEGAARAGSGASRRTVMRRFACLVVVLLLAGCGRSAERVGAVQERVAPAPPVASTPAETYAWARSDGQRMAANPELIPTRVKADSFWGFQTGASQTL